MTCQRLLVCCAILSLPNLVFSWEWSSQEDSRLPSPDESESKPVHTVSLQKQYVPVQRNGTTVAYKTAYFGKISAGNPAQNFTVVFDTGSGHLLLPSHGCGVEACVKHRRFYRNQSSTSVDIKHNGELIPAWKKTRDQVSITFGTGKVTGEFIEDVVCLGESREDAHCTPLRLVMANNMSTEPFALFEFDGVFGLGFGKLQLNETFGFFGQLVKNHPTMQPVFSVYLARDEGIRSSIAFGGYDAWRMTSTQFEWAPVVPNELGYWVVTLSAVSIGGEVLEECADGTCKAVLDTGTSLLGVPKVAVREMHRLLTREAPDEENGVAVDCRMVPGKVLEFEIGSTKISLEAEDYSRPSPLNMALPDTDTSTNQTKAYCRSTLMPLDMKPPLGPKIFILGEPVLRRYYTIYDYAEKRIGFTLANHAAVKAMPSEVVVLDESRSIGINSSAPMAVGAPLPSRSASVSV